MSKKEATETAVVKKAPAKKAPNDSIKKAAKPVKWFIKEAAAKRKEKK